MDGMSVPNSESNPGREEPAVSGEKRPLPKCAVIVDDALYPMPRDRMTARDILDQTGASKEVVLQRDYNSPIDHTYGDDEKVDLREGNVFKTVPRRDPVPCSTPDARPKLAFVVDDAWEVTVIPDQTGHSLKRLFGLPDHAKLFRDFESPIDQPIADEEKIYFRDGAVFIAKHFSLTIKVNNNNVTVDRRRLSGFEIKQAAIAQKVRIEITFVLYALDKDGNLGAAIPDDKIVLLREGDAFRCIAPDDNS